MVSLMSLQYFNLASWTECDFDRFLEWLVATIEMRSICLHNQSLKQRRVAKCTEVRDCIGFKFFNFFGSLMGMRRFATIIQYSLNYPEFMGTVLVCNLEPGSRLVGMIRRIVPAEITNKVQFLDRGNWKGLISSMQGLSLKAVLRWAEYLRGHEPLNWRRVSSDVPQTMWALSVPGPCKVSWLVQQEVHDASCQGLRITSLFLSQGKALPTCVELRSERMAPGTRKCPGSAWVDSEGVLLLTIETQGGGCASVLASLSIGDASRHVKFDTSESPFLQNNSASPRYTRCNLLVWLVVLLVVVLLGRGGYIL